jgi:hypothetical protein
MLLNIKLALATPGSARTIVAKRICTHFCLSAFAMLVHLHHVDRAPDENANAILSAASEVTARQGAKFHIELQIGDHAFPIDGEYCAS